jgi:K+ transport systems, NAD-binding component
MKVVIIGAGNVGFTSAAALSKVHDVLVVEQDLTKAENAKALLSVSVLHEDGSNPKAIAAAIERMNADIVLSAIPDDSLNLFICMMAKRIKPSIMTVACLRDPDFVIKTSSEGTEGVDMLISPELITANKIEKLATLENAVSYDYVSSMDVALATFRVEKGHNLIGKVVLDLDIPDNCSIIAIYRGETVILDNETAEIHTDDRICVLGDSKAIEQFNKLVGVDKDAKEFVILGASIVGIEVARLLSQSGKRRFIKIIEKNEMLCRAAARELEDVIIVNADFADLAVLRSENVPRSDVIIGASAMDERNLLACMAGMKFGTKKIISKYSSPEYEEIFKYAGVECIIGYHRVITSEITKNLVFDENAILTMERDDEYFFGVTLDEDSPLTDNKLGDIHIPEGIKIIAIKRDDVMIYPQMNTAFHEGDKVLIFTHLANPVKLSKLIGHATYVEL